MKEAESLENTVFPAFKDFKEVIDKYPNAFSLMYVEGAGYVLNIDLDKVFNP